mmetsp:Transcript_1634/g.4351  ORF Transcript_1634/g.4351 Transcript_1634/m.4351 type:complete len:279 (+) Transcript_1634:164-1000(+)
MPAACRSCVSCSSSRPSAAAPASLLRCSSLSSAPPCPLARSSSSCRIFLCSARTFFTGSAAASVLPAAGKKDSRSSIEASTSPRFDILESWPSLSTAPFACSSSISRSFLVSGFVLRSTSCCSKLSPSSPPTPPSAALASPPAAEAADAFAGCWPPAPALSPPPAAPGSPSTRLALRAAFFLADLERLSCAPFASAGSAPTTPIGPSLFHLSWYFSRSSSGTNPALRTMSLRYVPSGRREPLTSTSPSWSSIPAVGRRARLTPSDGSDKISAMAARLV